VLRDLSSRLRYTSGKAEQRAVQHSLIRCSRLHQHPRESNAPQNCSRGSERAASAFLWEMAALISSTCGSLFGALGALGGSLGGQHYVMGSVMFALAKARVSDRCAVQEPEKVDRSTPRSKHGGQLTLSQAAAHSPETPPSQASSASLMASCSTFSCCFGLGVGSLIVRKARGGSGVGVWVWGEAGAICG